MNYGTHPLTVEVYRARTERDARDVPMTAYSYKCAAFARVRMGCALFAHADGLRALQRNGWDAS